jgi:hypothetical protein
VVAVGLLSAKGSPGCTTTVLALSHLWAEVVPDRRVLIAECDAAGGDIASGYLSGAGAGRGVLGVASSRASDPVAALWDELLALDEQGKRLLLLGITDPRHAERAEAAWAVLADALPELAQQGIDVLLDLGRLSSAHEPRILWRVVDVLVLVTRSSLPAVAAAQGAVARLRDAEVGDRIRCLVVDERHPYSAAEVAESLDVPLLGTLPLDARDGTRILGAKAVSVPRNKSAILRGCRQLAVELTASTNLLGAARV